VYEWAAQWAETLARLRGRTMAPEAEREVTQDARRIERQWRRLKEANQDVARCDAAAAQLFIARCHGFAGWAEMGEHVRALERADSSVARFESAVDAIVSGDVKSLERLLRECPDLVEIRSTREHRSTLLHYVSANGVEDFRQKTPANIVEIAKMLLNAGADVNAESDAYGGRSTTLGMTATSCHPEAAGVQLALLDLLIRRGALIDGPNGSSAVNACLHNGRGEAAAFLANRRARLDLESASGVGQLDIVKSSFDSENNLKPPATREQLTDGFIWACEFGQSRVVEFLLDRGAPVDMRARGAARRVCTGPHTREMPKS
jgi:hypothetical protein